MLRTNRVHYLAIISNWPRSGCAHHLTEEGSGLEDKLRERATIDRAKAILIKVRRINEPEAYRWLRRQAMTRSRRIVDIAEEIVRAHEGQPA